MKVVRRGRKPGAPNTSKRGSSTVTIIVAASTILIVGMLKTCIKSLKFDLIEIHTQI